MFSRISQNAVCFWVDFLDYSDIRGIQRVTKSREMIYKAKIQSVHCFRIDNEYIVQRNNPEEATLSKRKIALVGCGTIGVSRRIDGQSRGAGIDGGRLTLIDNDIFSPQNIGRHRLGFNSILKNKAIALAEEICRNMPGIDVRSFANRCDTS